MADKESSVGPIVFQVSIGTLCYPTHLMRTLTQCGYEPLPSTIGRSWFGIGRKAYFLPGLRKYLGHLRRTEGIAGLYKGLTPHIMEGVLQQMTSSYLASVIPSPAASTDQQDSSSDVKQAVLSMGRDACIRAAVIAVAHPFHVVNVRMIAYYVGREVEYSTLTDTVTTIYRNEGIAGFFSGLMPRIAGEVLIVVATGVLSRLLKAAVEASSESGNGTLSPENRKEMQHYSNALVDYIVRLFAYPFTLTTTLMIVDGSGMAAAAGVPRGTYGWTTCLRSLYSVGQNMRGNSLLNRVDKTKSVCSTAL